VAGINRIARIIEDLKSEDKNACKQYFFINEKRKILKKV
jgi:hypothetical protein